MADTGTLHDAFIDELRDMQMGHSEVVSALRVTLEEEKATDQKLSSLGEGGINQRAATGASFPQDDDEEEEADKEEGMSARMTQRRTAAPRAAAKKRAVKKTGAPKSTARAAARRR